MTEKEALFARNNKILTVQRLGVGVRGPGAVGTAGVRAHVQGAYIRDVQGHLVHPGPGPGHQGVVPLQWGTVIK